LKERVLDGDQRAIALDTLLEQARKLERLLGDLLDLDRLRHGFIRPTVVDTDVARLVEQIVAVHANGTHPIELHTAPAPAAVDPAKVERMVDNLIANALRHTPAGTAVQVRVEARDGGVVIAVDDAGPGVAGEEREAIFEPFRRGSDVGAAAGTGIGLSLVAQFAALHGGRVWVEESPAGGASFRVFLPAR
jgi:signal transduction histidine kinase